ncbi:hypothetical protein RJZ57_000001 [Blastomyces gilchristii]
MGDVAPPCKFSVPSPKSMRPLNFSNHHRSIPKQQASASIRIILREMPSMNVLNFVEVQFAQPDATAKGD